MAVLRSETKQLEVPCRCLVGRSQLADVRLSSRRASNEHAALGWLSGRWVLRDLGSSNGTSVNGRTLAPRERVTLASGSELRFGGDDESWIVQSLAPPRSCAVLLGPQRYSWGHETLLVLPSEDAPEASVFCEAGRWRVDMGTELTAPECGDVVHLPSGYWRLLLPEPADAARALTAQHELDLTQIELAFDVSPERVALSLCQGATRLQLPVRSSLYTLLALARLRMEHGNGATDGGWISSAELAEMRGCSPEKVNVDIHRLRKLFQESGVHNAAGIVERDDAKRLRIGVTRILERRS